MAQLIIPAAFKSGKRSDWVSEFVDATEDVNSPDIFRKWAAIACLAGAMERRLYSRLGHGRVFPNLFVVLVGRPGSGKTRIISRIVKLWAGTKYLKIAPDSISAASLVDALEKAYQVHVHPVTGKIHEYHSLQICIDELGVLIPEYDPSMMSRISAFYDGDRERFSEEKRTNNISKSIAEPQINMLLGTQPDFLATLPNLAWGQGFMSRMMLIYSSEQRKFDIRGKLCGTVEYEIFPTTFVDKLQQVTKLAGAFSWRPEADNFLGDWCDKDYTPIPSHPRLDHYVMRRMLYMVKLSMIASVARTNSLEVSVGDVEMAKEWLLEMEQAIPGLFGAMATGGDRSIIQDLQHFLVTEQRKSITGKVREEVAHTFLAGYAQSERVPRIMQLAQSMRAVEVLPAGWIRAKDNENLIEGN